MTEQARAWWRVPLGTARCPGGPSTPSWWRWLQDGARQHEYLAASVLLAIVLCAYFWPLLGHDQLGQSHQLYSSWPWKGELPASLTTLPRSGEGDAASQFQPLLTVARHQLANGELPLWNPYSFAGGPLLGDMQSALMYPLTWLALIFSVPTAWGWIAMLKLLTAGLGTYALARQLQLQRGPALVAALIYMLCAPNVAWLQWPLTTVFSLFPWLLFATDRLYREPTARRTAVVGVAVALGILAGHPESTLLSSLGAGVYLIVLALADRRRRLSPSAHAVLAARWLGGHALGVLLSAVVLVPFAEAYLRSITVEVHGIFSKLHLPLEGSLLWVTPDIFGNGRPQYLGPLGTYVTTAGYFGIAALLLALIGGWRQRRNPVCAALAAMAITALMVVFAIPPVSWIVQNAPGLSSGNNVRVLFIVALAGALGAGAGIQSLLRRPLAARNAVMVSAGMFIACQLLVGLALIAGRLPGPRSLTVDAVLRCDLFVILAGVCLICARRLRRPAALVVVMAVVVGDLAYLQPYNAMLPPRQAYPPVPPSMAFLKRQPGPFHISSVGQGFFPPYILQPDTSADYGIEDTRGYEYPLSKRWSDFSWEVLQERGLTRELILFSPVAAGPGLTGLRLMNTRYYVAAPHASPPQPAFRTVYSGRDLTVFEDPFALPRAYVVGSVRRVDYRSTLDILRVGGLDPRAQALVPTDAPATTTPGDALQEAATQEIDSQHLRVTVPRASRGGWLVLANAYSPDWRATVDGASQRVYPTDLAAMGVPLAPGAHTVEFSLSQRPFWLGAGLSGLGLLATMLLAFGRGRRRSRPPAGDPSAGV